MNKSFISAVLDTVFAPGDTFQFDEVIDFGQTCVSAGGVYILEAFLTVGGGEEDGLALKEQRSLLRSMSAKRRRSPRPASDTISMWRPAFGSYAIRAALPSLIRPIPPLLHARTSTRAAV